MRPRDVGKPAPPCHTMSLAIAAHVLEEVRHAEILPRR
jgi:hypothetical protein